MAEPRIQYAKTSDGVSIAYSISGQGPTMVMCPGATEQFSLWQQIEPIGAYLERLGKNRMVVRYDMRGTGLSTRDVQDFSLEARLQDLEAVVQAVRLKQFTLYADGISGLTAIAYAARYPRLVSHLVLYGTFSRTTDVMALDRLTPLIELCRSNWELASQIFADMSLREQQPEVALQILETVRASVSGEVRAEFLEQGIPIDVGDLLPRVKAPTLVIHRLGDEAIPSAAGQRIAAGIPDARFVPLEGTMHVPFLGESDAVVGAIDEFLDEDAATPRLAPDDVHTILFTDVEGSTALTQRLGDAKARELLREHERITREALKAHGGSEIKTMGDGFMASFTSATKALECAIAMQRAFAQRNESAEESIRVRIGLNAGEPIAEDDPGGRGDLFGTAVNMAARIAAKADGGEVLASNVVRELVAGKRFLFNDRGETELRGFEDPVRLYEVRWGEEAYDQNASVS